MIKGIGVAKIAKSLQISSGKYEYAGKIIFSVVYFNNWGTAWVKAS
jgi:hypothetical protein